MRARALSGFALASLTACTMITNLDGLSVVDDALPDAADSSPTNDVFAASSTSSSSSSSSSSGTIEPSDASTDVTVAVDSGPCRDELLVGNATLTGSAIDFIAKGALDTYGYRTTKPGTAGCVWTYVEVPVDATVIVGVYAHGSVGGPSALLAEALLSKTTKGWNAAVLSKPVTVVADATYWIGLNAEKDGLQNRNHTDKKDCSGLDLLAVGMPGGGHAPDPFPMGAAQYKGSCDMLAYLAPGR